jgi:hypothetical protein
MTDVEVEVFLFPQMRQKWTSNQAPNLREAEGPDPQHPVIQVWLFTLSIILP